MKLDKRIIIVALLLAAATTFGVYKYLDSLKPEEEVIEYAQVWVAKETIPAKVKILDSMITYKKMDKNYVHPEAVSDKTRIVGKYTMERILKDEQIMGSRIFDLEALRFSYKVPPDMRAMTIRVDLVAGITDMITPGDHVDVLVHIEEREKDDIVYPGITKLFIKNVLVLSVDKMDNLEAKKADEEADDDNEKDITGRYLTLAVDPNDAERLVQADQLGVIRLALRHPEAQTENDANGAITDDFVPLRR